MKRLAPYLVLLFGLLLGVGGFGLYRYQNFRAQEATQKAEAFAKRGEAQLSLSNYEAALTEFDRALEEKPDLIAAHLGRGRALLALDRPGEAIDALDRCIDSTPRAHLHRARAHLALGHYEEARSDAEAALKTLEQPGRGHLLLARIHLGAGNHEKAIQAADAALSGDPDLLEAHTLRGDALQQLGRDEEAARAYKAAKGQKESTRPERDPGTEMEAYALLEVEVSRQAGFFRAIAERLADRDFSDLDAFLPDTGLTPVGLSTVERKTVRKGDGVRLEKWISHEERVADSLRQDLKEYLAPFETIRNVKLKIKTMEPEDVTGVWDRPCPSCEAEAGESCLCPDRPVGRFDLLVALTVNGRTSDGTVREDHAKLLGTTERGGPRRYRLLNLQVKKGETITSRTRRFSNVTRAAGLAVDVGPIDPAEDEEKDEEASEGLPEEESADARGPEPAISVPTDPTGANEPDGGGIATADYDRDGDLDLYVVFPYIANALFRNRGDGTFEKVTVEAGVSGNERGDRAAVFFDYDGDGWLDLFVAAAGAPCHLYRNEGDGTFTDRTETAGLDIVAACFSVTAADADRDGDLDLAVACYQPLDVEDPIPNSYVLADNGSRNLFFRNEGDGTFTEAGKEVGLTETRWSFALSFGDLNDDGWPDLYVANDYGKNGLFINQGDGTFLDQAEALGAEDIGAGMGVAFGDLDGDLDPDIYVSNMYSTAGNRVLSSGLFKTDPDYLALLLKAARGNSLLVNQGSEKGFRDRTKVAGVGHGGWAWGNCLFDPDNDGDLDIYALNGNFTTEIVDDL